MKLNRVKASLNCIRTEKFKEKYKTRSASLCTDNDGHWAWEVATVVYIISVITIVNKLGNNELRRFNKRARDVINKLTMLFYFISLFGLYIHQIVSRKLKLMNPMMIIERTKKENRQNL